MSPRYPAIEGEQESELEYEWEGEEEGEQFSHEYEEEFEGELEGIIRELEGEFELENEEELFGAGQGAGEFEGEEESEVFAAEFEGELEYEHFADPSLRAHRQGVAAEAELMAHLATEAANAESEAEAEAFLGALVGPALRLGVRFLPKALPAISRVAAPVVRSIAKVGGQLWRHPETRKLVKALPSAALRTFGDLATQWGDGQDITARKALGTLGSNLAGVLSGGRQTGRLAGVIRHVRQGGRPPASARKAINTTGRLDHTFRTRHPAPRRAGGRTQPRRSRRAHR
jgi:hypothetical protein